MSDVAKRYARAAVEAAADAGGDAAVETLARQVSLFRDAYDATAALRDLMVNPALRSQRGRALDALLQELGIDGVAVGLVRVLAQRDRMDVLDSLASEIEAMADQRIGRLRAQIRSAIALSDAHEQRIAKALEKRFGRPVVLSVEVDPELLGGLVCQVGDFTLDSSVRRQLEILRERLGVAAH